MSDLKTYVCPLCYGKGEVGDTCQKCVVEGTAHSEGEECPDGKLIPCPACVAKGWTAKVVLKK